ncbi:hypothetical protein [Ciceribacter azotifigens]|uniref:hypothetical protein n=1 Tax=Ciceribacter azotifigens TaxID=2069303 RepID=UPI003A843D9B
MAEGSKIILFPSAESLMEEASEAAKSIAGSLEPLKDGDGGGTYSDMSTIGREEHDAKLAATEARIDATLARLDAKLSHLPTTAQMWIAAASSVLAVAGVIAAFLAFGSDRFNGGLSVGIATVDRKLGIEQVINENAAQTKQIEELSSQIMQVLTTIQSKPDGAVPDALPVPKYTPRP